MALDYHISEEEGLINLRGAEQISMADIFGCGERLLEDAAFDAKLPQLVDLRDASIETECLAPGPTSVILHKYNEVVCANVAVVIQSDLCHQTVAELYRITCMVDQAELFDDYDQALRWLIRTEFASQPPSGALRPLGEQPDAASQ